VLSGRYQYLMYNSTWC